MFIYIFLAWLFVGLPFSVAAALVLPWSAPISGLLYGIGSTLLGYEIKKWRDDSI